MKELDDHKQIDEAQRQTVESDRNRRVTISGSEAPLDALELSEIVDTDLLQSLMVDAYQLTGIPGAVIDPLGNVLVAVGWQDICTKFHRCQPSSCENCIESDTILTQDVAPGTHKAYRCKNNLWEVVTPLMIQGRHVGNVFIGQFLYEDEEPDVEIFHEQAQKYGFDEKKYLAALDRVPRFSKEIVKLGMNFYIKIAGTVTSFSFSAIEQSRLLSERKKVETALRASERLLNQAERVAHLGSWEIDLGTNRLKWSAEAYRIFGVAPDQFKETFEAFLEVVHPDDEAFVTEAYATSLAEGRAGYEIEHRVVWPNGEIRYVHEKCVHERNDEGKIIRSFGMSQDITERKKAELALRQREEMMRNSQSLAHICSYSTDLNVIDIEKSAWVCSPEFYTVFGIDETYPHTIAGWANFIHPDFREEVFGYHESVVRNRTSFDREYKIIRINDGAERWVHGTGKLEYDAQGNPVRMHGAIQDITERKEIEENLQETIRELERFNAAMVDRELKMIELKKEINNYCVRLGLPQKYRIAQIEDELAERK